MKTSRTRERAWTKELRRGRGVEGGKSEIRKEE
jgi:hypothetical protein